MILDDNGYLMISGDGERLSVNNLGGSGESTRRGAFDHGGWVVL